MTQVPLKVNIACFPSFPFPFSQQSSFLFVDPGKLAPFLVVGTKQTLQARPGQCYPWTEVAESGQVSDVSQPNLTASFWALGTKVVPILWMTQCTDAELLAATSLRRGMS